jgi:hypothetical protein
MRRDLVIAGDSTGDVLHGFERHIPRLMGEVIAKSQNSWLLKQSDRRLPAVAACANASSKPGLGYRKNNQTTKEDTGRAG